MMNPATITALCTGIAGVITAVTALVHSLQTRRQQNQSSTTEVK